MRPRREPAASSTPASPSADDADARALDWIERARGGDREAFRSLYLALHDPVSRFVARRIHGRADAEDLVARVFFQLLARLEDFDARRGSVLAFVIAIARSRVIDHARTARDAVSLDEHGAALDGGAATALDVLIEDEEGRRLHRFVRELPEETREMFALRYADGLKHHEIAAVLGLSVDNVKQRFSRALRALRERIEREDETSREDEPSRGAEGALSDVG
jgi:RNA polymerase sigma-70 factor (ECF subfamily)